MSKAVFEKCPNCNQELHNALYRHLFGNLAGQANTFEYECKACGAVLEVEAVPVPEFYVTLKSRPTQRAVDGGQAGENNGQVALPTATNANRSAASWLSENEKGNRNEKRRA